LRVLEKNKCSKIFREKKRFGFLLQNFHARQSDVDQQREELRKNLRQRFAQLCVNGL
jgi:hypothetical protein